MESLRKQATRILREQKKYKLWLTAFLCLAVLVTAGTVAALTMSGQALNRKEKVLTCQLEVHQHAEECKDSEGNLVCGQADYVVHVHNDDCYKDGELVCTLPQVEPHTHTEECFQEQKTLVCTLEENEGHVHDENCYTKVQGDLICDKEGTGHQHGPECYTKVQGELICASEEEGHEHTDECYAWSEELTCGETEEVHEHTDECYEWKEELTCQIAEGEGAHKHTDECCEIEMVNTCGQLELHTHDESCYEEDENGAKRLVCGQTELLEHVHGEDCFVIIEPDVVEESEEASEGAEETSEALESTEGTDESAEDTDESGEALESTEGTDESAEDTDESGEAVESTEGTDESAEDTDESTEADGEEEPVQGVAGVLTAQGSDYTVTATFGEDAGIPEGAELIVREVEPGTEEYETHYQQMLEAIGGADSEASADETDADQEAEEEADNQDEVEISFARLFDISFVVDGEKIEPNAGASVDIRISYQDAMECVEGETASAVHFAKDGTEILEADVVESEEGSDFVFTQDSFSMTFSIKMIKAPNKKKTDTLTTEVGDISVTVTGESADSFSITDKVVVNEIKDNGKDVESGNNRYRKYLDNSKGAIKDKVSQEGEEVEVYSARVFEISIEDSNGRKKQANNVKVEIQYRNGEKTEKSGKAVMILNSEDSGDLISSQSVAENQEIPVFTGMQTFSASAPNVVATMMVSAVELADTPGSGDSGNTAGHHDDVSGHLESSAANDWQIVDKGYEGNATGNKVTSDDGMVRVQKNVIPTDVENEFLVYLSIDMKSVFERYFELAEYKATPSNNFGREHIGTLVSDMTGNQNVLVTSDASKGYKKHATFTMLDPDGKVLAENVVLYWSQGDQCTFYIDGHDASGKYLLIGLSIKNGMSETIRFSQEAMDYLERNLSKIVELGTVTDLMGESAETGKYITCTEIIGGDYFEASISPDGKSLTWKPSAKPNPTIETTTAKDDKGHDITTTWMLNVAELVYKVRLDVTEDGFHSCANNMDSKVGEPESYRVNASAKLDYMNGDTPASVDFPVPYVRGLLYDLTVEKRDAGDNTVPLYGAKFKLKNSAGNFVQVKKEDGSTVDLEVTTDRDGKATFSSLPWGNTYTLVETQAPEGYQPIQETNGKTVKEGILLCYTDDMKDNGNLDSIKREAKADNSGFDPNMKYKELIFNEEGQITGEKTSITITNEKIPLRIVKVWDDESYEDRPDDVTFSIYYDALVYEGEAKEPKVGEDGKLLKTRTLYKQLTLKKGEDVKEGEVYIAKYITPSTDEMSTDDRWVWDVENIPASANYYVKEEKVGDQSTGDSCIYEIDKRKKIIYWEDAERDEIYDDNGKIVCSQYTITNRLKNRPVTIIKKDKDSGEKLSGASFKLYAENPSQNEQAESIWKTDDNEEGIKVTDAQGEIDAGELKRGTYYLVEEEPPEGYKKIDEPIVVTVTPGTDTYEVEVENELDELPVEIWKVDSSDTDKGLLEAVFTVKKWDAEKKAYVNYKESEWTSKTAEDGTLGLLYEGKLPAGKYMLTEENPPDGYNKPNHDFVFTVGNEVTKDGDVSNMTIEPIKNAEGEEVWCIKILNDAGAILPETGGKGTIMYTLGGMMLVSVTALLMYGCSMRRKKSERRLKQ